MSHNNIDLSHRTSVYRKNQRRRRVWKRIVSVLGCIVVFVTTYALILPAITLDDEPICGFEEHRHDSSCYVMPEPGSQPRCSAAPHVHSEECDDPCLYADFFLHSHDTDYSQQGTFVCSLPELEAHTHDQSCFTESIPLVCGTEESDGHAHSEGCFTESLELTCTVPESEGHLHEEACFDENGELVCKVPESEAHAHGEGCYTTVSTLICEISETEGHTHGDACQGAPEQVLTCDKPEYIPHTHEESCFAESTEDGEAPTLICGATELLEHIHSDLCLAAVEVEPVPVLICEKEEHTHADGCFPLPEVSTAAGETGATDTTMGTEATLGTAPTDSTLTTEPTETMAPTAPTDVTDPTESTETTDVTDPTETSDVTDPTETTEVTEPVVLEVIEKVAVIYTDETYAEISTDTTVITVTGLIPADAEIRAYPVTVQSEKDVLCAFDLTIFLPDGSVFEPAEGESLNVSIQAPDLSGEDYYPEVYYIPEDGDPEHIDTTVTENGVQFDAGHFSVYAVMAAATGEAIPTGAAGSYWHSTVYPRYQRSPHRPADTSNIFNIWTYYIDTFVLIPVDEYGGKTWEPDSIEWTASGNHNYVVTYCADIDNPASDTGGILYIYKTPLGDTSFSASQQATLQAIIENGYPFISEAEMAARLTAAGYSGTFTEAEMLTGVQWAIWETTDGADLDYRINQAQDNTGVLNPITGKGPGKEADVVNIMNFLLDDAESTDPGDLTVTDTAWTSTTDGILTITVTLNRAVVEGESVEATVTDGTNSISKTLTPGTTQFTMVWTEGIPEVGSIRLSLSGSRQAWKVYYYDDAGENQNMISGELAPVSMAYEEVLISSATDVTVEKKWVETDSSTRPESLTVYLTINGTNIVQEGLSPVVLNADNNWTYTWTDMPVTRDGVPITYSVNEVTPAGYSGKITSASSAHNITITITNTQIPVELQTSLTVTKEWEDGNATHSGQAVIVHLYADGVYTGRDLVLSDDTNWIVSFTGLPYYQEDGVTPIEYTIVEEKVEGYVPDYGDTTPTTSNAVTWEQATSLEAGSVYRFVTNGLALSCDESGNLTATTDTLEDKHQWWSVASSGSTWTLTNVATGKMVNYSSSNFNAADSGVSLTFSNKKLSYRVGSIFSRTYYMRVASNGSISATTLSSSGSSFTLHKKTSVDKVPAYNITLTNQLAPSYELPETGGMGTEIFTFGGTALMAAALMWGCTQRRKRERRAA